MSKRDNIPCEALPLAVSKNEIEQHSSSTLKSIQIPPTSVCIYLPLLGTSDLHALFLVVHRKQLTPYQNLMVISFYRLTDYQLLIVVLFLFLITCN